MSYPHIEWIELENAGILVEVAIMRKDGLGNMYFIRLDNLDMIDKQRLLKIITNRNAEMYELWDLMSNVTLGNGCNALDYFHQLVKVLTPSGQVMTPTIGQIGAAAPRPTAPRPAATEPQPAAKVAQKAPKK